MNMKESPDDTLSEEFKCALMPIDLQYVQPPSIDVQSIKMDIVYTAISSFPSLKRRNIMSLGRNARATLLFVNAQGKRYPMFICLRAR